jgi:hypothetical protein
VAFQSADQGGTRDPLRSAATLPQSSGATQERMNSLRAAPFSLFVAALSLQCASTAGSTSVMASSLIAPVLGAGKARKSSEGAKGQNLKSHRRPASIG